MTETSEPKAARFQQSEQLRERVKLPERGEQTDALLAQRVANGQATPDEVGVYRQQRAARNYYIVFIDHHDARQRWPGFPDEKRSRALAERLNILGFLNLQLAVKNDVVYMLEANPRSSRSVPFIMKSTGIPLVDLGVLAMLGVDGKKIPVSNYQ